MIMLHQAGRTNEKYLNFHQQNRELTLASTTLLLLNSRWIPGVDVRSTYFPRKTSENTHGCASLSSEKVLLTIFRFEARTREQHIHAEKNVLKFCTDMKSANVEICECNRYQFECTCIYGDLTPSPPL